MVDPRMGSLHSPARHFRWNVRQSGLVCLVFVLAMSRLVTLASVSISINHGRARVLTQQDKNGILVHRSVLMRMEADERVLGKQYKPRLKFAVDHTWVD